MSNDVLNYDAIVVGAGPAGLAASLFLARGGLKVCLLDKAARLGGHLLSGAVIDKAALSPLGLDELPPHQTVTDNSFLYLTDSRSFKLPTPPPLANHDHILLSLGDFARWLGNFVTAAGVDIFPGFAVTELLENAGKTVGVRTGAHGLSRAGKPKPGYQPGVEIMAPVTLLAEGCRGFLSQQVMKRFNLAAECGKASYGLGFKEVWKTPNPIPGKVIHTIGAPFQEVSGGGFLYGVSKDMVAVGVVISLDYQNPHLDPFAMFQQFKLHPTIKKILADGEPLAYGARTVTTGGWQSLPRLDFPGGLLIGDGAGFLNPARLQGVEGALISGRLAAEAVLTAANTATSLSYYPSFANSSWGRTMRAERNIRPGFRWGKMVGMVNSAVELALQGRTPWTIKNHFTDRERLQPLTTAAPTTYNLTPRKPFLAKESALFLAGLSYGEDQPSHLEINPQRNVDPIAERYCPGGVFSWHEERLVVQAENCLHCKCCDIKDPEQAIRWTPPQGGDGPDFHLL